jgi:ABC-2 type transport system permease protein
MTTDIQHRPAAAPVAPLPRRSRLLGLGSVFGKAVRDSRRAFLVELALLGGLLLAVLAGVASAYPTQAARDELVRLANDLGPAAQGVAGKPVNVGTMGGYVQWKYGPVLLLIAAFWSILALSGSLAGEARRGSLDLVAASPLSRRRIAAEKVAALWPC